MAKTAQRTALLKVCDLRVGDVVLDDDRWTIVGYVSRRALLNAAKVGLVTSDGNKVFRGWNLDDLKTVVFGNR